MASPLADAMALLAAGRIEAVGGALLATAAIAGVAGFVVLELGRSNAAVVLAPRATPSSLGLTLVGRL